MSAINDGQVLRYLTKPWRHEEVADVLRDCIDLVHLQRTVQDMEVRLLRRGQSTSAYAIGQELAQELASPLAGLDLSARLVADLLTTSIGALDDRDRIRDLLTQAIEAQTDAVVAVEQMRSLVVRLRQGQRPSSVPAPQTCDVSRVVDSTIRIVRQEIEKHATLLVELEGAPMVPMEASALGQVVLNLLLSASRAVTGPARDNVVAIKVIQGASEVRIVVSDTGPGFAPEDLSRVFDPYFSGEPSRGLGLAVVKELIRLPEGRITARSELGKGATFTVCLPRVWEE
jgi:signal transduction histidine kinase